MKTFLFADSSIPPTSNKQDCEYWNILVADDDENVHRMTSLLLQKTVVFDRKIKLHSAFSADEAKEKMQSGIPFCMAFIDVVMESDHAGLELVDWIRKELNNREIRLIIRTGQPGQAPETEVIRKYDINDYRSKTDLTVQELNTCIYNGIRGYRDILLLTESLKQQNQMMYLFSDILENDKQKGHGKRIAGISKFLAEKLGLDNVFCNSLYLAAPLHDIGKRCIPEEILLKPSSMNQEEWAIMDGHCAKGAQMLADSPLEEAGMGAVIARHHHENWDGSGYPDALSGQDIPVEARIVSVADAYVSLSGKRVYAGPWAEEDILEYLQSEKGRKFDPRLIDLALKHSRELKSLNAE